MWALNVEIGKGAFAKTNTDVAPVCMLIEARFYWGGHTDRRGMEYKTDLPRRGLGCTVH